LVFDLEVKDIMGVLRVLLTIVYIIDCVALAAIVLMQEGKSAGLGAIAGAAETYWGQNKGRSMEGGLVKLTKILAAVFFILSLVLSMSFLK
jgi:preprotein translocase subunit SecG